MQMASLATSISKFLIGHPVFFTLHNLLTQVLLLSFWLILHIIARGSKECFSIVFVIVHLYSSALFFLSDLYMLLRLNLMLLVHFETVVALTVESKTQN